MSIEQAVKACYQAGSAQPFVYQVAADFPAFAGHFEDNPVLPAVCHISFCSDAVSRLLGKPMELACVKKAKFIAPVFPNMRLAIRLTARPDGKFLADITQADSGKKFSQLVLQFIQRI